MHSGTGLYAYLSIVINLCLLHTYWRSWLQKPHMLVIYVKRNYVCRLFHAGVSCWTQASRLKKMEYCRHKNFYNPSSYSLASREWCWPIYPLPCKEIIGKSCQWVFGRERASDKVYSPWCPGTTTPALVPLWWQGLFRCSKDEAIPISLAFLTLGILRSFTPCPR